MKPHMVSPSHPVSLNPLFDRLQALPTADSAAPLPAPPTESWPTPEIASGAAPGDDLATAAETFEPSDHLWEPYADWRPPCFGRLALEYATRFGLYVLPLLVEHGAPASRAVPRAEHDASRDPATIHAWWTRAPYANVGIACSPSRLLVLEVNPQGGGAETLAMHAQRLGPLPVTWTARTHEGWTQYFFSCADGDACALPLLRDLGPGVRVLHRGFVLAPPSVVGGRRAAWHLDGRPGRVPRASMPAAWMDRLTGRKLPPDGLSGLDARHSILGRVFEKLGCLGRMLRDGRRMVQCPWADEHSWSGGYGDDPSTVLYSPEDAPCFGRFLCQHPECADRGNADLFDVLPQEAFDAAHAALPGKARDRAFELDAGITLPIEQVRAAERVLKSEVFGDELDLPAGRGTEVKGVREAAQ